MAARKKARKKTARKKTTRRKAARKKTTRKTARKKAGRKKAGRKKTARKKAPARKKATRKKAARKKAPARKKATRKKAARKTARKPARKKAPQRKAAAPKSDPLRELAKKIIMAASADSSVPVGEIYAPNCVSHEPGGGEPARGHAGLEAKLAGWNQIQEGTEWTPVSVNYGKNTIAIEWDATVKLRSGPTVSLREVAVHEIKGGRIISERYYYDPSTMGGGGGAADEPEPAVASAPEVPEAEEEPQRLYEPGVGATGSDDDTNGGPSSFDL